jgi:integrase
MNHLKGIQQRQGIYEQVSRVRAMCRDIYDYAKVTGRIDYNPLEGIQKYLQQGKKENMAHVSEAELPTLIRAINNYPTTDVRMAYSFWQCCSAVLLSYGALNGLSST